MRLRSNGVISVLTITATQVMATPGVYMNAVMRHKLSGPGISPSCHRPLQRRHREEVSHDPSVTPADYNDYLGQLYGLRALSYFYALRVWGAVPLTLEPWDGETAEKANLPRTTEPEIKAQILSDIDKSIELLNSDVSRKFYFNRAAAWALKTDLHMVQGVQ